MGGLEFDTSRTGLGAVLKDWQIKSMQVIWSSPDGANSRTVWTKVNQMLGVETISRASIINFLEAMREMGVLDADERTGKGGHFFVYRMGMDEKAFQSFLANTLVEKLLNSFPEETRKAARAL